MAVPCTIEPNPLWKSSMTFPSTSQTRAPLPCERYIGHGSRTWYDEETPFASVFRPARTCRASRVRSSRLRFLACRELPDPLSVDLDRGPCRHPILLDEFDRVAHADASGCSTAP